MAAVAAPGAAVGLHRASRFRIREFIQRHTRAIQSLRQLTVLTLMTVPTGAPIVTSHLLPQPDRRGHVNGGHAFFHGDGVVMGDSRESIERLHLRTEGPPVGIRLDIADVDAIERQHHRPPPAAAVGPQVERLWRWHVGHRIAT